MSHPVRALAGLTAVVMAGGAATSAQPPPTELARQHLESGIQFYEQGRYKQALNDFQIIATSMSTTEYADDALLRIGRYYLEIEEDFDLARDSFDSVLRGYPTGDAAPGAYYFLGEVLRRSDRGGTAIDDALANYQRVFLYPDNPWIPAALFATGASLERQEKFQDAIDTYFQVIVEYASSEWAAPSQLGVGRASLRLGKPLEAMSEFQRARNEYPQSASAEEALDWLTLLYRFYGSRVTGEPFRFRKDPNFNAVLRDDFKDVKAVRVSDTGIHVLERGRKRVLTFDRSGKLAGTQSTVNPYSLFVDPRGDLVVANEKGLVIAGTPSIYSVPGEDGPEQLEKIRGAARDRLGEVFVYDDREKRVLRFSAEGELLGPFPDATPREVLQIEVDKIGNVLLLDKKDREVSVFAPDGRRIARIQPKTAPWALKKPCDIALDNAGFLYILDEDQPKVAVFDGAYQFVAVLSEASLGGGALREPTSLDVDASGDLYVYDDKEKTIVRLH